MSDAYATAGARPANVLDDLSSIHSRLQVQVNRLTDANTRVSGPRPQSPGGPTSAEVEPPPSIDRLINLIREQVTYVEDEVATLTNRI
jgi:hypothetical protein